MLTHKVKHQMKTEPLKREFAKPLPKGQPSNKGSPSYPSKPVTSPTSFPQEDHAPQNSHPPQNEPSPDLITLRSCFKCQDLDHIALECRNGNITSLAECEGNIEEKEDRALCLMEESQEEEQEEVVEEDDEGELLKLRRNLTKTEEPLKDGGVLSTFLEPNPVEEPNDSIVFNDSNLKPYLVYDKLENLRTNSCLEGENDVYLLGVHCHSFNPTPWGLSSTRVQACQGSFWTLTFEFHDKRHIVEFYLARKELRQSNGAIGTSPRNKPMFVCLLDQVSLGVIALNLPYF